MAWTIVPEHDRLHVRAIVRGRAEITEVIECLQKYLTLEEYDDRPAPVHARPTTELGADPAQLRSDDAAARAGGTEAATEAETAITPVNFAAAGGTSDGSPAYSTPEKIAGGPSEAASSSEASEVSRHSYTSERTVPRYPESE